MSIAIAILGLALLIFVHEAGHFFASLAVGLRPRRFYVGFPPALVKTKRNGIEYAIGVIPLGGFVTIPGMLRPIGHDAERRFSRAVGEAPALAGPADRVRRSLESGAFDEASVALDELDAELEGRELSPGAASSAAKGLTELRDSLGPDAYWKAPTWKRIVAIAAGPAANVALAIVLFAFLFMTGSGKATSTVAEVVPEFEQGVPTPALAVGLEPGDRIVAIDGRTVPASEIPDAIASTEGRAIVITVVRDGNKVELGPVAPFETEQGYRMGFALEGEGLGFVEAVGRAFEVTGIVSKEIVKSLGRLVTGDGRDEVSSPIGITQASSDAVERGAENYLFVLALISLSLALLNLLPLLPLDGGHILFSIVERARGRFVQREVYERVSVVGLAVVLLLFFVGLSNDIGNL
jgi:regulator of sigma E protease